MSIFSVTVLGSTELYGDCPLRNVAVRISVVSIRTGELVKKRNPDSRTFSAHEYCKVIPQISTRGICCDRLSTLHVAWNETFVFNEEVHTLLDSNNYMLFEVIDMTVHKGRSGFNAIAWAFLRSTSSTLDQTAVLQLYCYPSKFDVAVKDDMKVPVFNLFTDKTEFPARLTIQVKKMTRPDECEINGRPRSALEREIADKSIEEMLETDNSEEEDNEEDMELNETQLTHARRKCAIPNRLAAHIIPGENGVMVLRFNRSGTMLVAATRVDNLYCLQFYECDGLRLVFTVEAHMDLIYELAFSSNNKNMLSVSSDGVAKVWSVNFNDRDDEGAMIQPFEKMRFAHPHHVYTGKFHPHNDKIVVTGDARGVIRVWNRASGECVYRGSDHVTRVNSIVFSPNGKFLYSGDAEGIIGVWEFDKDDEDGKYIVDGELKKENEIEGCCISHLSMGSSDRSLLVFTHDNIVRNFDTEIMLACQRFVGATSKRYLMPAAFSPDISYVFAGSENGSVMLWSVHLSTPITVKQWHMKFRHPVTAIAWNEQRDMVAFGSFGAGENILVYVTSENPLKESQRTRKSERLRQTMTETTTGQV